MILICETVSAAADPLQATRNAGPLQLEVRLEPDAPRYGDTLTLTVQVTPRTPEIEVLMPSFDDYLGEFRVRGFSPREISNNQGVLETIHTYSLEAPLPGRHAIPELPIEWSAPAADGAIKAAPDRLVHTPALEFTVASNLSEGGDVEVSAPLGIVPEDGTSRTRRIVATGGGLVLLMGGSAYFLWRRARGRPVAPAVLDPSPRQRLDALRTEHARGPLGGEHVFAELAVILRDAVATWLGNSNHARTTEELLAAVERRAGSDTEFARELSRFLRLADLVKFASWHPGPSEASEALTQASWLLDRLEPNHLS